MLSAPLWLEQQLTRVSSFKKKYVSRAIETFFFLFLDDYFVCLNVNVRYFPSFRSFLLFCTCSVSITEITWSSYLNVSTRQRKTLKLAPLHCDLNLKWRVAEYFMKGFRSRLIVMWEIFKMFLCRMSNCSSPLPPSVFTLWNL